MTSPARPSTPEGREGASLRPLRWLRKAFQRTGLRHLLGTFSAKRCMHSWQRGLRSTGALPDHFSTTLLTGHTPGALPSALSVNYRPLPRGVVCIHSPRAGGGLTRPPNPSALRLEPPFWEGPEHRLGSPPARPPEQRPGSAGLLASYPSCDSKGSAGKPLGQRGSEHAPP